MCQSFDRPRVRRYYCAPMSGWCPETIEPWRLVEAGGPVSCRVEITQLPRLASALRDQKGTASIELEGLRERGGWNVLRGTVRATLNLTCQRCLGGYTLVIDQPVALGLIESGEEAEELPSDYDPLPVPIGGSIALADVLCDELILALPVVPRHGDESECDAGEARLQTSAAEEALGDVDRQRPFAGLGDLMGRTQDTEQE